MPANSRRHDELRPIRIKRRYTSSAPGSVLIQAGETVVLCTASIDDKLPPWLAGKGKGWVTAEYSMLPGSTAPRKPRERGGKVDGRSTEIQRLIGRSLRSVIDTVALGARTIAIDCDVIEADGGTRTLAITGGFIALVDAISSIRAEGFDWRKVFTGSVAAVSVGVLGGTPILDLEYTEDSRAEVDMNVVMTGEGKFGEVQGTAEHGTFSYDELQQQLGLASTGIRELTSIQKRILGDSWPTA